MNRMHRGISLAGGCFIALVALARLSLRLINTHMLISYSIWYLFYLAVPQLVDLAMAGVLLRGRRDRLAGLGLSLGALYTLALSPLLTWMVNRVFPVSFIFNAYTIAWGIFYLLAALDCFLAARSGLGKLRLILPILPLVCFLGVLAVDIHRYSVLLGDSMTFGTLMELLFYGMPGLAAELLTGMSVALSLIIAPKAPQAVK